MSGDATIDNAGALTIANDAVTTAKILDATIASADIANDAVDATRLNVADDGTEGQTLVSDGDGSFSWAEDAAPSLDDAYNNFGATASKITIDASESQTGGLEFELSATNNPDMLIEERTWGSLGSAGTDIFTDQTAAAAGTETTTLTNAEIDAKDHLVFTTGTTAESGTVDLITVTVYYYRI